jgi:hypothetical protein
MKVYVRRERDKYRDAESAEKGLKLLPVAKTCKINPG